MKTSKKQKLLLKCDRSLQKSKKAVGDALEIFVHVTHCDRLQIVLEILTIMKSQSMLWLFMIIRISNTISPQANHDLQNLQYNLDEVVCLTVWIMKCIGISMDT